MPITARQADAEERRKRINGSDLPLLFGFGYRNWNLYDLWLDKRGMLLPHNVPDYVNQGRYAEIGILAWAASKLGKLRQNVERTIKGTTAPNKLHTDAIVRANGEPVEAKNAMFASSAEKWGEEFTDEVPPYTTIQAHGHMMATDRDYCHVPVQLYGRGYVMFGVSRQEGLCQLIIERMEMFWEKCVVGGMEPRGVVPSMESLKNLIRQPHKIISIPPGLHVTYQSRLEIVAAAQALADETKQKLLAALGDAEAGQIEGVGQYHYLETHRKGYEVKPATYRQLRFKALPRKELKHGETNE